MTEEAQAMSPTKFDISSTVLEKSLEIARSFLDKLIMPAAEETGLLLRDRVTLWKLKNQVSVLNKAKQYCEKHNISTKVLPLKVLCPLLDYSGIEEDPTLLDKWSVLLANMVDSEQNIQNHVFPYILSQLSLREYLVLEKTFDAKVARVAKLDAELSELLTRKDSLDAQYDNDISRIDSEISEMQGRNDYKATWDLRDKKQSIEFEKRKLSYKVVGLKNMIQRPESIPSDGLQEFELHNVIRLGLIKEEREISAPSQTLEIPGRDESLSFDIDIETTIDHVLTELGELFIVACKERRPSN